MRKKIATSLNELQVRYDFETEETIVAAKPFIKWAGGKNALITTMAEYFPKRREIRKYYEPFLGGGAVFFALQPPIAILCDSNKDLIELYQIVRDDVDTLISHLKLHFNDKDYFYRVRAQETEELSPVTRAARFIFLNKTCFNGLYRVNSKGKFNVPFGKYSNPLICDSEGLRSASLALQRATLLVADFEVAVAEARMGDFVYFDPPYHPLTATSSFTAYTSSGFNTPDQYRLATTVKQLTDIGVKVMISNSDTPMIRELYSEYRINEVLAKRAINCKAGGRGKITELLITNY